MKPVRLLLAASVLIIFPVLASAQATRTWVSGVGDDVNPCSRTAPCKTFAGAISKTATGGEINALDPGGYGTLTITKSITVDGGETMASTLACSTTGFVINATATSTVTLRNISINGCGNTTSPGTNGVRVLVAKNVHLENLRIFGFRSSTGRGVDINTSVAQTNVMIHNLVIEDNSGAGIFSTVNGAGTVNLSVDNSQIVRNGAGIDMASQTDASITRSNISHNVNNGINSSNATVRVNLAHNSINENNFGIASGGDIFIFQNQITKNGTSLVGTVTSHGLNQIVNNGVNNLPTTTPGTN